MTNIISNWGKLMSKLIDSILRISLVISALGLLLALINASYQPPKMIGGYAAELHPCLLRNLTREELKNGACWK